MIEKTYGLAKYSPSDFAVGIASRSPERVVESKQLTAADVWDIVVRRRLTILGLAAIVLLLSTAYAYTRTPVYEGVARVQIDPSRSTSMGLDDGEKRPTVNPDLDSHVKTEVAIIGSDTVALRVMNALKLYRIPQFAGKYATGAEITDVSELSPSEQQHLLATFRDNLDIKVLPNSEVVEIHFRSADPNLSAQVSNAVVDEYMQRNFMARVNGTAQVSIWISKQLDEIRSTTAAAQQKLADFQRDNNFLGIDESDNIVTNRLKQLNEELTQAEADRIIKEGKYRLAETGDPELIDSTSTTSTIQALRARRADLQAQYLELDAKFGNGYPKLRQLQQQLAQLSTEISVQGASIKSRLGNEFQAAAKTEQMIRTDFTNQKEQAHKLNEHVSQYAILKHEVEAGQRLYDTLQLRLKTAGITSGLASSFIDIIDRAQVPDRPVSPRKSLFVLLGLGGGLFVGLLLGVVQDSFDDTIRTSEELEGVTGMPELASVPFVSTLVRTEPKSLATSQSALSSRTSFAPIVLGEQNSPSVESYRALCSTIILLATHTPTKALVVTSAISGEGKSTVSSNLATALAERGRKVLLIDADLRCSSMYSKPEASPDLSTLCSTAGAILPLSQPIPYLPTLHVVPAGVRPSDPAGVLDSTRMRELMATWRAEYDHIIIDTPPALPFADALVVAAQADAVVLVARSGLSRSRAVLRAKEILGRSGANILGVVLNAVRQREYYYDYPAHYVQPSGKHHKSSHRPN